MPKQVRPMTMRELRQYYMDINRGYFDGKLPKGFDLRFGNPRERKTGKRLLGITTFLGNEPIEMIIRMDHKIGVLLTLIHEMIHTKFVTTGRTGKKYDCHSPKKGPWGNTPWAKEVRRLARIGLFDFLI